MRIDLLFVEVAMDDLIEFARGRQISAERLFDDHAPPGARLTPLSRGRPRRAAR